jgi:hypothetical protein
MKQETPTLRRAAWLLAAAALPLTPLAAQEVQPPADPPATTAQPTSPPPEVQAPVETTSPPPAAESAPAPVASTPRRTTTRSVARTVTRAPVRVPVAAAAAPTPVLVQTTPPAAVVTTTTTPAVPAAPVAAAPVETLPTTPSTGTDVVPVEQAQPSRSMPIWPWLLLGLALVAGALLFARRRRAATSVEDNVYEPAAPVAAPVAAAPVAAAAVAPAGRPRLDLALKPRRAGVAGSDARVEFELTVDNRGNAPAEDVRIATWMLAAGASEAERALIEPAERADSPPVTIDAGQTRTMEAAVALPTAGVNGDSILPVVVADARYRLPDGREEHTRVSYAVGVPDGEELMHFDTESPSGLHEGVVAQALGEPERV